MNRRVVILVTHLLGIGHLVRASLLADSLTAAGFETTLISGGRQAAMRDRSWHLVQLAAVHIEGTAFAKLLDEDNNPVTEVLLAARRDMVSGVIRKVAPACLVTEHFPFGRRQLAPEFEAAIETARMLAHPARIVASIRDVLVAPQRPGRVEQANARVERLFDAVLVHGDAAVLPLSASWPATGAIERKLHYTGYVAEPGAPASLPTRRPSGEILVSGGGSAAALPLFHAAIAAGLNGQRRWRILIGHGVDADDFAALGEAASPAGQRIVVERARADFPQLLADCAVSVSMAGYNTMLDLARAGVPSIVVPFDAGNETEQAVRATAWARAGLVRVLPSSRLSPGELDSAIDGALSSPTRLSTISLDGATESARIIGALITPPSAQSA